MRKRRGTNIIEFALTAPVLFALLTGMMDLSFVLALRHAAGAAAQHGARVGAGTALDDDPEGAAAEASLQRWSSFGLPETPTITTFRTETSPDLLVVRITVDAEALVGLVPGIGPFEVTRLRRLEEQP